MGSRLSTPDIYIHLQGQSVFDRSIKHLYDSRPMSEGLPIQIDPLDLARNQIRLQGQYQVSEMPRLAEYSPSDNTEIYVRIACEPADGLTLVKLVGEFVTELQLQCERCLGPLKLSLNLEPAIYFTNVDQLIEEHDDRDIIVLESPLELRDLVEEEILLALPMMPMHQLDQCKAGKFLQKNGEEKQRTENPFSKLAKLKIRND